MNSQDETNPFRSESQIQLANASSSKSMRFLLLACLTLVGTLLSTYCFVAISCLTAILDVPFFAKMASFWMDCLVRFPLEVMLEKAITLTPILVIQTIIFCFTLPSWKATTSMIGLYVGSACLLNFLVGVTVDIYFGSTQGTAKLVVVGLLLHLTAFILTMIVSLGIFDVESGQGEGSS